MSKKSLCILVPVYNEEKYLTKLLALINELSIDKTIDQVIFIDDGSSDNSLEVLSHNKNKLNFEKVLVLTKPNNGKASAIKFGLNMATSSHVIIFDSDLELLPKEIVKFWSVVARGDSDFVFGYRSFRSHSSFTYKYAIANKFLSNLYGILFNELISDIMCGIKLVPADFLRNNPITYRDFRIEFEIPFLLKKAGIRAYEIEVEYYPRSRNDGKNIKLIDAVKIIITMVMFKFKYYKISKIYTKLS